MPGEEYGKQDRGVPAGTETPETFVKCARNNGLSMMLMDAQLSYLPYMCNPNHFGNLDQCPHQKACLALHMEHLHGTTQDHPAGMGEDLGTTPVRKLDIDAAFSGLTPRADHQRRADDAEEKTQ
jgi:hypothetical protein